VWRIKEINIVGIAAGFAPISRLSKEERKWNEGEEGRESRIRKPAIAT
jgi:hypothetical protein